MTGTGASHQRLVLAGLAGTLAIILTVLGAAFVPRPSAAAPAKNESPRAFCARVGNDDELRTAPASLASAIKRLFNLKGNNLPTAAYYRCAAGHVLACWVGANIPCGKANTAKTLPAATEWCATHPDSDFIPMVVTGHDTLYSWRCVGHAAQAGAPAGKLDARGFFDENWKRVN
jgi:hypothetical protein